MNPEELHKLDKAALDKEKVILEIKNLTDAGQSRLEIFMKRRIIPVLLPFITLSITVIFFCINRKENEKSKAQERYNSEVDMVKMVWNDMKVMDTSEIPYKSSKEFLIEMFKANEIYYKKDSKLLGIGKEQRPIMVLTNLNLDIHKAVVKYEKNKALATALASTEGVPVSSGVPINKSDEYSIIEDKLRAIVQATDNVAGNDLKVYIQYTSPVGKDKTEFVANRLRSYYIVPPIDLVGSREDDNEVRYYTSTDIETARILANHLERITGLKFKLKNINNNTIKNTIEVWYCNTNQERVQEE